jgi:hypothetical protein
VTAANPRRTRLIPVPSAVIVLAVLTSATAYAASTRAEYVAQVDPICRAGHSKEKTVVRSLKKRARQLQKRGIDTSQPTKPVIRIAVRYYDRIAAIQRDVNGQISLITPAPGDEATISQWLRERGEYTDLFNRSFHVFAHGKRTKRFKQLIGRAFRHELDGEELVGDFGFQYCTPFLANP